MRRDNKQSVGTIALFLWFAFINFQFLLLVVLMLHWRLHHPKVPLSTITFWRPELSSDLFTLALIVLAMTTAGLGLGLGFRFFAAVRAAAQNPHLPKVEVTMFVFSLVLLETTGLYGVILAFLKGPASLGVPFVVGAIALTSFVFPSSGRFTVGNQTPRG